jgi:predicted SprT family Zn-dependent metalloprotease
MNLRAAEKLARSLMREHQLLPKWSFQFDSAKLAFGKCNFTDRVISLSRHLVELNNEAEVRDTVLHEIAHALAPRGAGHGPKWRAIARQIGCRAKRCYGREVVRPKPKFKGTCPSCRTVIFRYRRAQITCAKCSPLYDPRFAFIWSLANAG